jgi:hypothetical protein
VLTDEQRRLYARQVLLRELGMAGQARLCESKVVLAQGGDALVTRVCHDYLERAGLALHGESSQDATAIAVPSSERVQTLAGTAALADCAAWLLGAWTAVETIKRCVQVGREAELDPELVLNAEVV